jgi:hypothetical protein
MSAFDDNSVAQVRAGNLIISIGGKQPDKTSLENKKVIQQKIRVVGEPFFVEE